MNIYARRHIKESIPCACGCGKLINRYDARGREKKYHKDCFSPGIKLNSSIRKILSVKARSSQRIKQSIEKIAKVNQDVQEGKRLAGHYIDGYLRAREDGYLMVKEPNHPRAHHTGYIFEHILVAEKKLGRLLREGETVHHINRNPRDNHPDNIMILKSVGEHQKLHSLEDQRRNKEGKFIKWKENKNERV